LFQAFGISYLSPFVPLQGESLQGEPLSIKWREGIGEVFKKKAENNPKFLVL
jgi:hypothetical protein